MADGFEEIEALTTVDVLRRAELEVVTVGIGDKLIPGCPRHSGGDGYG